MAPAPLGGGAAPPTPKAAEVKVDWEALWLDADGPSISDDDLALVTDLFNCHDPNGDGILHRDDLALFCNLFEDLCGDLVEFDDEGDGLLGDGPDGTVDPQEWVSFNVAAACTCGQKAWRKLLDEVAAVNRIKRSAMPEDETWVIRVDGSGSITAKWFSDDELQPDERLACRALKSATGWRCLSCEAEALDAWRSPTMCRISSAPVDTPPPAVSLVPLQRVTTQPVEKLPPNALQVSGPLLAVPEPATPSRCASLEEMLSHRALRALQTTVRVGDRVMISSIAKCDGLKPQHLGTVGTVMKLWVPEQSIVKTTWCELEIVEENDWEPARHVLVPIHNTAHLKVPLHPGDVVEAYRPVDKGRRRGERSPTTSRGTVLELLKHQPHMARISFGPGDTVAVPAHWIMRLEMSAWTQVLRSAPHSTVMFLLCDLQLSPGTPQDKREFDDRLRRDFEPHGRFRFVGAVSGSEEDVCSPKSCHGGMASPKFHGSRSSATFRAPRLAVGDCGKVLSFDLKAMQAEVMPDRKKHLRLRIRLADLEPDPGVLAVAATSGPTRMHAFDEDPPLLAAIKRSDVRALRKHLAAVPRRGMMQALLEDNMDADGNLPFHAAVYEQSVEMWRIIWSALDNCPFDEDVDAAKGRALEAADDWGRTPLWIALEKGHTELCKLLLAAKAPVDQEAPVLPESETAEHDPEFLSSHEFCGGPGMVAEGTEFEVTFYRPALSCGLNFAQAGKGCAANAPQAEGELVVVRTYGEAADACIMAGDVLLSIGGHPATNSMKRRLATEPRPFTLRFRKGSGLWTRPLHRACELGHHDIARLLLDYDADPGWRDLCMRSAMDRAVRRKNRHAGEKRAPFESCIAALEDAGASEEGRVTVADAQGVLHAFEPPEHWDHCGAMRLEGRFWLRIEDIPAGEILDHLQRVVDRSIGASGLQKVGTRDRRGAVPQRLQVVRAQRVENVASLREYLQRRSVLRDAVKQQRVYPIQDLRVKVDYSKLCDSSSGSVLAQDLNEVFLFHGTNPDGARGIARENFLLSLAGSAGGSAFGSGIYFAEDCIKSDEYTEEAAPGHEFAGLRPLLLCRVLLGRVLASEDKDVSWEIGQVMQSKYDSLLADRKAAVGTYREFIIFDENQAYADYIVWYRRRYG